MESSEPNWRQLAAEVTRRRRELGLTQEDVRMLGGPSTATMRLIEGALQDSYRPAILARLERALGWAPGGVETILAGGDPTELPTARVPLQQNSVRMRSDDQGGLPDDDPAVQLVMDSDLPWGEKKEIITGLIAERLEEERRRVAQARRYIDIYRRAQGE